MKILKMIGLVVAVHVVAFAFLALPACQSSVRTSPQKPAEPDTSDMSRLDAARARTGGPVPADTALVRNDPAAPAQPAQTQSAASGVAYTPVSGPAFAGGAPVIGFGAPVIAAGVPPARPQSGPEAVALPAEPEQDATLTYTVVANDNPWTIARKFKITTKQLTDANNLPSNPRLQIGQKLKIPAKPAIKPATPGTLVYKVKANDSLGAIARRYNTTVEHIQSLNNMKGSSIRVNQELVVPAGAIADASPAFGAPAAATATDAAPAPAAAKPAGITITHTVKPGDSLSAIATYYGTTRNAIAVASHLSDPNRLREGQKLTVPNATKNTANATPATASASASLATTTPAVSQSAPAATPMPASTTTTTATTTATTTPVADQPVMSPISTPETAPVIPVSPIIESPLSTSPADAPPVHVPVDAPPIVVPQN